MGFSATSEGLFSLLPFQDEDDHNYPYTDHGPCGEEVDYPRGNGEEREREGVCRGQVGDCYQCDGGCLSVLLCSRVCSDLVVAGVEAAVRTLHPQQAVNLASATSSMCWTRFAGLGIRVLACSS